MDITTAQLELRHSYLRGGPGAITSGIVWLIAGVVANNTNVSTAFMVLFFGGMLISPLSTLIERFVFRRSSPQKSNQGLLTVIETTFPMIGGLIAAWLMLPCQTRFCVPAGGNRSRNPLLRISDCLRRMDLLDPRWRISRYWFYVYRPRTIQRQYHSPIGRRSGSDFRYLANPTKRYS